MSRSLNRGRPHTSHPALADKPGVPGWSGRAHRPVRSSTASPGPMRTLAWFSPGLDLGARDRVCQARDSAHRAGAEYRAVRCSKLVLSKNQIVGLTAGHVSRC